MKKKTTTVSYQGLLIDLTGYYTPYCKGSYIYNEGGAPESESSFDVHSIDIEGIEMIDNLTESFIDELVELALINLK
jgi:hypothetical protein